MTAPAWWSRLRERRRLMHESPFSRSELDGMRRKVWRLVRAGKS